MKPGLLLLPALLITMPLIADEHNADAVFRMPLTNATRPVFLAICASLAEKPVVKGTFTQTKTLTRLNRRLVSGGVFIIAADHGIVWDTHTPFPSTMAVGRDYAIQSRAGQPKTTLNAAGNDTFVRFADTISAVFSGNAQKLSDGFDLFFAGAGKGSGQQTWVLGLIPREAAVRAFAARITLEGDSVIRVITLYEQSGDTVRYELTAHTFPAAFTALDAHDQALFAAD